MAEARNALQDVGQELEKVGSNAVTKLRSLVSRDKYRVKDNEVGVDLDLSYITDRVIAMGIPAQSLEMLFRNNISDVVKFMDHHHAGKFLIFNLSEKSYDTSKFGIGAVKKCGWPDHHAPPLAVLFDAVQSMDSFLSAHPDHVVAIHCLAGRGRTGTVIACYLLYTGVCSTPEEALRFFADRRSRTGEGVAVPSQLRYVDYFYQVLRQGAIPHEQRLVLKRLELQPVPGIGLTDGTCAPFVEVVDYGHPNMPTIFSNQSADTLRYRKGDFSVSIVLNVPVSSDVLVRVYHQNSIISIRPTPMFKIQFNTAFVTSAEMALPKCELDNIGPGVLTDKKFAHNFVATLFMELPEDPGRLIRVRELPRADRERYVHTTYAANVVPGAVPSKEDVERSHRPQPVSRPPPVRDTSVKNPLASYGIDVTQKAATPQQPMLPPPPVNRESKPANYFASPASSPAYASMSASSPDTQVKADIQERLSRLSMDPVTSGARMSAPTLSQQCPQYKQPSVPLQMYSQPLTQPSGSVVRGIASPMLATPLSSPAPQPQQHGMSSAAPVRGIASPMLPTHLSTASQSPAPASFQQAPAASPYGLAEPELDLGDLPPPDFSSLDAIPPPPTGAEQTPTQQSDILGRLQRL